MDSSHDHHLHHHMHHHNSEVNNSQRVVMDMNNHNHSAHTMQMWFHGGCNETILFTFWTINSDIGLFISCILIFAMAALYEGVKWFRLFLQFSHESSHSVVYRANPDSARDMLDGGTSKYGVTSGEVMIRNDVQTEVDGNCRASPFSPMRITQALLYLVQLTLAYFLMLIVMTYNSWLTASVIIGAAFGHWLFAAVRCLIPQTDKFDTFATDACH